MGSLPTAPHDSIRKLADAIESQTSVAMERLVASDGFSELFVRVTENVFAVAKIRAAVWDLALSNVRLAGQRDVDRLARQLRRTEDKLEVLLQAVERLEALPDRG